jgi:hypothetical protein
MLIQIYLGIKCTCHLESWQERSQCSLLRGHAWTVAPNLLTEEAAAPSSDEVKKAGMLLANYKPPSQARQKMCTKHHSATAAGPALRGCGRCDRTGPPKNWGLQNCYVKRHDKS